MTRTGRLAIIGIAVSMAAVLFVAVRTFLPPRNPVRPNVILILVDALRADRVGAYGNEDQLSRVIDELAGEGVTFENAIAAAPWTQPSIASLFSALNPGVHKVLDHKKAMDGTYGGGEKIAVFSDSIRTLAECFQENGYETAAFCANPFVLREYGFAQGFGHFDARFAMNTAPGSTVNSEALKWLRWRDASQPLFLYLHYMDVHGPYRARPEILSPMLDELEERTDLYRLSREEFEALDYLAKTPVNATDTARHQRLGQFKEYWVARYDSGVREMDVHLAALRYLLQQMGLWDEAYIVLVADHGEALLEHGFWDHAYSLYHTDLHIPMILRWPGRLPAGKRVREMVRLIDVMPTLLDQLGLPPVEGVQGVSLAPLISGKRRSEPVVAFAEGLKTKQNLRTAYRDGWKVIRDDDTGEIEIYHLAEDYGEQRELSRQEPAKAAWLAELLTGQTQENEWLAAGREMEFVPVDEKNLQHLRSIGYFK